MIRILEHNYLLYTTGLYIGNTNALSLHDRQGKDSNLSNILK